MWTCRQQPDSYDVELLASVTTAQSAGDQSNDDDLKAHQTMML